MAFSSPGQPGFSASNPSNPATILAQADQLRQAGRMTEAEQLVRAVVTAHPNLPSALNMLALFVRHRGDNAEAEALMRRAIAAAPREAALHNNLGNILLALGKPADAESSYRAAIAIAAAYPEAWYNLGVALREQGRTEQAIAAHRNALTHRPDYPQAKIQLGALLIQSGQAAEALTLLEPVAKAYPQAYDAQYYRGSALLNLDRPEDAILALQAAVELAPERHEARFALAQAFVAAGRQEDGLLAYQRTFECKPDFLPALYDFASLAWSMGNGDKSLNSYTYARAKLGDTPDLLLAEANLRMRLMDSVVAESLLRRARNMAPERADIADALGRALSLQTRFDESFQHYQHAVAAEPGNAHYRQDLAEAYLRAGEAKEAVRLFDDARKVSPYDQIVLAGLILALREAGDSRYDELVDLGRFVREYEIEPPRGYSDLASFNRVVAEELEQLHTAKVEPLDQTLRNGTQTAGALFAKRISVIEQLREQIRTCVADYVRSMPDVANHPLFSRREREFSFSGSWSCRLRSSGFHTNHIHDQGWISSAYYVSLPEEVAQGGPGAIKFGESKFLLGERDRPGRVITPSVGKLVLFPSYFWHGTVPFQSDAARLTVAFDVVPGPQPVRRNLTNY
jgi:tetratricopeptide (TPR) repeat protein